LLSFSGHELVLINSLRFLYYINPYIYRMKRNIFTHIISLFFVTTFLLLRVVDIHSFSHFSDDNEDPISCELCEIISISNQYTPFTNTPFEDLTPEENQNFSELKIVFGYETSQFCITLPTSIYNKPPPFLL